MSERDFERAKVACRQFLPHNWTNVNAIETSLLSGGRINVIVLCSLKQPFRDERSKPHEVSMTALAR